MNAILESPKSTDQLISYDEFHNRYDESGRNVVLIEGEVFEMPGAKHPHDRSLTLASMYLNRVFAKDYWIRNQMSLHLSEQSDPIPDLAVVAGDFDSHQETPSVAVLIIEVSDSTLRIDRMRKANVYAQGKIPDYWIIDINNRQLIVLRDPTAEGYQTEQTLAESDSISPLSKPDATILVRELLP